MKKLVVLSAVIFVLGTVSLSAQEKTANSKAIENAPETYVAPMGMQFTRGVVNAGTGWCEIPRQVVITARDEGGWLALPVGIPRGIIMTVARTFYGVVETAFFYIPFEPDYQSAMEPAFVWQDRPVKKSGENK
jgi:putative exosortase-associated protein (TIGR04073 family)